MAVMPATIPSHQAGVLPLKLISPRRFDGVALVIGSVMPDVGYLTQGLPVVAISSHAWHSLLWFSLPLTLIATWLVRRAAGVIAVHLPDAGPLALRDYGVLATVRHRLVVSVWSALLGAASHMVWDMFTHPYILFGDPFTGAGTFFPALHRIAVAGLPWWRVIYLVSEVVGSVAVLSMAVHIGRRRLLLAWHGPVPQVSRVLCRPVLFWSAAAAIVAVLTGLVLVLPGNASGLNVIGIRLIVAVALALLGAAAVVRVCARRTPRATGPT